jgi:hypothetical protein
LGSRSNVESVIPTDVLLTIAEVAIAVLGFAAIVTALRRESAQQADLLARFRLGIMIETSTAVLLFSFLPFVFRAAGLLESSVASLSSALFAVAFAILVGRAFARQRRQFGTLFLPETRLFDVFGFASAVLLIGALSLRSAGLLPQLGFAPYVTALLFFLFAAIQVFVRIVFFASDADAD